MFNAVRLLVVSAALFVTVASSSARAQSHAGGNFGLGIVIFDPTAITAKYNADSTNAYDFGLAFDMSKWTLFYADWHYMFPGAIRGRGNAFLDNLTPYVGVGGLLVQSNQNTVETRKQRYFTSSSDSRTALGVRIPLGMEWRTSSVPLGVFLEFVPGITILPATNGFFQAGLGARFYF